MSHQRKYRHFWGSAETAIDSARMRIEEANAERTAQIRVLYRFLGNLSAGIERRQSFIALANANEHAILFHALRCSGVRIPALLGATWNAMHARTAAMHASRADKQLGTRLVVLAKHLSVLRKAISLRIDALHQRNRDDWERYRLLGTGEAMWAPNRHDTEDAAPFSNAPDASRWHPMPAGVGIGIHYS